MKTKSLGPVVLVPAVLAAALIGWQRPGPAAANERTPAESAKPDPVLDHTAVGIVVKAHGGVPRSSGEWMTALRKHGDFIQLPVSFSAVALDSGLGHPRVIITLRPAPTSEIVPVPFTPSGGWGGSGGGNRVVPTPLPTIPPNAPYFEGRLFIALNLEKVAGVGVRARSVEFISWNSRKKKFDFGVVEYGGEGEPEVKMLDGAKCFSCHKNKGPILGVGPWSNTTNNAIVRSLSEPLFSPASKSWFDWLAPKPRDDLDGLRLLSTNGPEVDAGVRFGADVVRDREIFRALARAGGGRRALVMFLTAIATPGSLADHDQQMRNEVNQLDLIQFITASAAIQKATPSGFLADYSPSGSMGTVISGANIKWGGAIDRVSAYDEARALGQHGIPSQHQPSNPKAYLKPPVKVSNRPADMVSAVMLARTIGLSEGDRAFLANASAVAAGRAKNPKVTAASVAKQVFSGPAFADVLKTGDLPDRDEFKDRFVAGLAEVTGMEPDRLLGVERRTYAVVPKIVPGEVVEEVEAVPTTACLRCHDVKGAGKAPAFSPIPVLMFDPFDGPAREAWVKTADRKTRAAVLGRLLKRLVTDQDMPPEDAAEHELFRGKDPASFDAVRQFLEAELAKVKGN